jgi:hypothetical protein
MARLFYLNRRGHTEVAWDVERAGAGDAEALAAVAEAERVLGEAVRSGYTAFAVRGGTVTRRVDTLGAVRPGEDVMLIPAVAGG